MRSVTNRSPAWRSCDNDYDHSCYTLHFEHAFGAGSGIQINPIVMLEAFSDIVPKFQLEPWEEVDNDRTHKRCGQAVPQSLTGRLVVIVNLHSRILVYGCKGDELNGIPSRPRLLSQD
ncbi:hypothetical protein BASA62_001451 [Batrachochytrium salamandrivorans]|nr:hypothetical protein BASA62_001451 [Batrachochytrium salamandrivorans]